MNSLMSSSNIDGAPTKFCAQVIGSCRELCNEYNGVFVLEFTCWWGNGLRPGEYYREKDNQV